MKIKTAGTDVYALVPDLNNPTERKIIKFGCLTQMELGEDSTEEITVTCINRHVVETEEGRTTLGNATIGIYPSSDSEVAKHMWQLKKDKTRFSVAIGLSDGEGIDPELKQFGGRYEFGYPETRSWLVFDATCMNFPFEFPDGGHITSNLTLNRKTEVDWYPQLKKAPKLQSISALQSTVNVDEGAQVAITLKAAPEGAPVSVTWEVDDETIAKISQSGVVTGVKEGVTSVRATSTVDKDIKVDVEITVSEGI